MGGFWRHALKETGAELHDRMVGRQSVCLRQLGEGRAGEVRFGRFLRNRRVTVEKLIACACMGIGERSGGRHVLLLEDTSEINYQAHARRVSGLGTVGNGTDAGLFVHPVLAVDAQDSACLGLAHIEVWRRIEGKKSNYRHLPIEQKESWRWIDAAEAGKKRPSQAARMTVIADREADIYEMWARLPDSRTDLLIRASRDRALETGTGVSLFAWLGARPVAGSYRVALPAVAGKRSAHEALLHVRFGRVTIKRPRHCSDPAAPESLALYAIEVIEDAGTWRGTKPRFIGVC